jgi:hypothetical protein|tara:strand:+ start:118 stop:501 length:384 start_codon:yes stop_codon:yes gene_type:complete
MTEKKYTEKQAAFLEALMGEARGNIRKAMDLAGYSKGTNQGEVTGPLREEIIERASMMLAMNAPKAAHGLIDVLNDPTALGARNAINAAREVLDRTGLIKKEKIEVTNNGGGMFILPPKADDLEKQN